MQLEVGKKYRTRDGEIVVEIVDYDDSLCLWPYIGNIISDVNEFFKNIEQDNWDANGFYSTSFTFHRNDLTEEVTD